MLLMEGEATDRVHGDIVRRDALFQAVLRRGLKLTTDLDHLSLLPTPGWRTGIDRLGAVTVQWPHFQPLLKKLLMGMSAAWITAASGHGIVLLFVGSGFGLYEHAGVGMPCREDRVAGIAHNGALATSIAPFQRTGGG
ncbi:hypothetical protein F4560_003199 [Saccharothrix ecbatanensis]|uniref:Uncharacterized protein n=1 Tax=Saccharothrix ecbatanensis TaxID=1105145 RepID=A0A7W9HJV9_9PSEU|nr:hypothetical protein [Saccharothrix ecbatanensis]MBB5803431.1 hypothetical protein [Saccharothrix ecbatanensis]